MRREMKRGRRQDKREGGPMDGEKREGRQREDNKGGRAKGIRRKREAQRRMGIEREGKRG